MLSGDRGAVHGGRPSAIKTRPSRSYARLARALRRRPGQALCADLAYNAVPEAPMEEGMVDWEPATCDGIVRTMVVSTPRGNVVAQALVDGRVMQTMEPPEMAAAELYVEGKAALDQVARSAARGAQLEGYDTPRGHALIREIQADGSATTFHTFSDAMALEGDLPSRDCLVNTSVLIRSSMEFRVPPAAPEAAAPTPSKKFGPHASKWESDFLARLPVCSMDIDEDLTDPEAATGELAQPLEQVAVGESVEFVDPGAGSQRSRQCSCRLDRLHAAFRSLPAIEPVELSPCPLSVVQGQGGGSAAACAVAGCEQQSKKPSWSSDAASTAAPTPSDRFCLDLALTPSDRFFVDLSSPPVSEEFLELEGEATSVAPKGDAPSASSFTGNAWTTTPKTQSLLQKRLQVILPGLSIATPATTRTPPRPAKTIQSMSEEDFAKRYTLQGVVQESCHAGMSVLFAEKLADGQQVVVKVRCKRKSFKHRRSEEFEWRATMQMQLALPKSQTICDLMEVIETEKNYYVVMEKVEGKDLFETMQEERITHKDAREIVRQLLEALTTLHGAGRIHKDLKLENVMVDLHSPDRVATPSWPGKYSFRSLGGRSRTPSEESVGSPGGSIVAKVIDFDTVTTWEPSSPKADEVLGTNGYIAPEAYCGDYSPASDMYSVGVIMYKLLSGRFPLKQKLFDDRPGQNYVGSSAMMRVYRRLKDTPIDFSRSPLGSCDPAAELCRSLLCFDAQGRPSAEQALQHEWFQIPADDLPDKAVKRSSRTSRTSC